MDITSMLVLDDARSACYCNKDDIINNIKYLQSVERQKVSSYIPLLTHIW